jgi:hypothetical protein
MKTEITVASNFTAAFRTQSMAHAAEAGDGGRIK